MPVLYNWSLEKRHGEFVATGIVSGHRKLAEGLRIHTSPIQCAKYEGDGVYLETRSGSHYCLKLRDGKPSCGRTKSFPPEAVGLPCDLWARCARAARPENFAPPNCIGPETLFLRVVSTHILSAIWIGRDRSMQTLPVYIYPGLYCDTCRIGEGMETVDLRLMVEGLCMKPYHNIGVHTLLIRNEGNVEIIFCAQMGKHTVRCPGGKDTVISPLEPLCTNRAIMEQCDHLRLHTLSK